jgi:hypothetical protein
MVLTSVMVRMGRVRAVGEHTIIWIDQILFYPRIGHCAFSLCSQVKVCEIRGGMELG